MNGHLSPAFRILDCVGRFLNPGALSGKPTIGDVIEVVNKDYPRKIYEFTSCIRRQDMPRLHRTALSSRHTKFCFLKPYELPVPAPHTNVTFLFAVYSNSVTPVLKREEPREHVPRSTSLLSIKRRGYEKLSFLRLFRVLAHKLTSIRIRTPNTMCVIDNYYIDKPEESSLPLTYYLRSSYPNSGFRSGRSIHNLSGTGVRKAHLFPAKTLLTFSSGSKASVGEEGKKKKSSHDAIVSTRYPGMFAMGFLKSHPSSELVSGLGISMLSRSLYFTGCSI
ncbi:hypothetical protein GGR53DRAFT_488340 [Hypoxylon sp. FL1150]|nr:hypothetical protein GGR53DRAFT_488340 [Hypoxylon sp. FL1150]